MTIQWLGHSCFKIQTKNNGQEVTIITDPYDEKTGLKVVKQQADIVTISHDHDDHSNLEAIKGEPFVISTPGEFETKGIFIYGVSAFHDDKLGQTYGKNTIYKINSEDINILHLGDLGQILSDEQLEQIGNVDILMIPVGGTFTLDAKKAVEVVAQVEPRLVIPMHYKTPGLKWPDIATADEFIKLSGLANEKTDKLKVAKKDLIAETTKMIILSC
ncbi:MAG: MBL fold metallo-hydrolase [Patescibacteria group bacterium]